MDKDGLTIAFVGGGTGGHVTPVVSLIEYAQKHSEITAKCKQLYRFGEADSLEEKEAKGLSGVIFVPVLAGKMRRYRDLRSTFQNIRDLVKVSLAFFQSGCFLIKYNIDIIFCKGGYVALPVCRAARVLGKKIILHESDMHPGLTNRLVAKFAHTKFTGFPDTFDHEQVVGQILSSHLMEYNEDEKEDKQTHILIMGGSQGAQVLLEYVYASTQFFDTIESHVTVILGTKNSHWREKLSGYDHITLYDFVDQATLATLYAQTDVAITRAGVTSLAEQQLFGIKKIIIPHPYGGGYHQLQNALWYSEAYEDIVIEEDRQLQENIQMFLERLAGYKKEWSVIEGKEVEEAKGVIWKALLNVS